MVLEEVSKQPKIHEELPGRTNVLFKSKKNKLCTLTKQSVHSFHPNQQYPGLQVSTPTEKT